MSSIMRVRDHLLWISAPPKFCSAPRPSSGRSFLAPRAPSAPAPLPTLARRGRATWTRLGARLARAQTLPWLPISLTDRDRQEQEQQQDHHRPPPPPISTSRPPPPIGEGTGAGASAVWGLSFWFQDATECRSAQGGIRPQGGCVMETCALRWGPNLNVSSDSDRILKFAG